MATRAANKGISLRAILGSRAILLAMDAESAAREGLLGFAIGRKKSNGETAWMRGFKFFEEVVQNPQPGERRSTLEHPIQSFLWGDYSVTPGKSYQYVVMPVRGRPATPDYGEPVELEVVAAREDEGEQSLFFNRF